MSQKDWELAQVPRLEPLSQLQPCGEEKYVRGVQEEELPEVFLSSFLPR